MSRLRRFSANALLAAASFAFVLGAAELALRFLESRQPGGKEQVERNSYTEADPVLGWRKRPGAVVRYVRRDYSSEFTVNSRGLRGPERPYERTPGAARVLALGDSFVEAFMVTDAETVTARLESRLRAALSCPVEVLNGGTVGYSTDQEYLFYRDEGARYRPDAVVLFTYHNDLPYLVQERYYAFPKPKLDFTNAPPRVTNEPVPAYVPLPSSPPEPPAPRGSRLIEFVKDRIERSSARTYNRLAAWGLWEPLRALPVNEELNLYRVPALRHLDPVWSAYTWTVESLRRATDANGTRLVLAYVPSRMEVNDADLELTEARYGAGLGTFARGAVRDRLSTIATRLGVPFLDLTPALRSADERFRPVYFATDSHWNARGQDAAAQAIADFLRARSLAGCPAP